MSTLTNPPKGFKHRIGIRRRAAWRAYCRATFPWVENPPAYLTMNGLSLLFALLFLLTLLSRTDQFWNNITGVLAYGWAGLLFGILALTQIKLMNKTFGLPVVGAFLVGASAYFYEDARSATIQILNRHFPFSTSQLTEAIESSTRIVFAIEIASFMPFLVLVWYALLAVQSGSSVSRKRPGSSISIKRSTGAGWFVTGSSGMVISLMLIATACWKASSSFGLDVMFVRAAYERDFTSNFRCDSVPQDARVLLSKMSDNVGYAVTLTFPNRPFFRMKETDDDLKWSMPLSARSYRIVNCNKPSAEAPSS
ncbi:hypothetical protein [Burkholderia sp. LMG 13014]|uniref:hypothetical protein n=1 Tax=Burkholderia sp. LMG 13014 TaxID=2709306 RepID=UPI001964CE1A|nr:hypothetical protein [Burkholderia sp. LMG 13014]